MTDLRTKIIEFVAAVQAEAEAAVGPDTIITVTVNFAAKPEDKDKMLAFAEIVQAALKETNNQVREG